MDEIGLLDGIATTRAIRRYRPEAIPETDLAQILFAATRAPSGSNDQSFRFLVLRDGPNARRARAVLGDAFRAAWDVKSHADGFDRGSGSDRTSRKARLATAMDHFVEHFEETPVIVLACLTGRRGSFSDGASIFPACQNLLLAARGLGYGGVMTVWHLAVEEALRELLHIPAEVIVAATIPLGRPAGRHGPVRRRPLHELVFEDGWASPAPWSQGADPLAPRR